MDISDTIYLVVHLEVLGGVCGERMYIRANWYNRGLFRPRVDLPRLNQTLLLVHVRMLEECQLTGREGVGIKSVLPQDVVDALVCRKDQRLRNWGRDYMGRVVIVLGDIGDRFILGRGQLCHGHLSVEQSRQLILQLAIALRCRQATLDSGSGIVANYRDQVEATWLQLGFSMNAAREREISETCPQDEHWCKMEEDMVPGPRRDNNKNRPSAV